MQKAHMSLISSNNSNKKQTYRENIKNVSMDEIRSQKGVLIVCDSPHDGHLIYYQDKKKSKKGFWTNYRDNALVFYDRILADQIVAKLRYNNPRVISE